MKDYTSNSTPQQTWAKTTVGLLEHVTAAVCKLCGLVLFIRLFNGMDLYGSSNSSFASKKTSKQSIFGPRQNGRGRGAAAQHFAACNGYPNITKMLNIAKLVV